MSLSVEAAAREATDEVALVADEASFSFHDLARAVAPLRAQAREVQARSSGPYVLRAKPVLDTLLTVYALVEENIPFVPIHSRLADAEAASLISDLDSLDKNRAIDDRTLAVVFTSGTSGKAKGAILDRSAFEASAHASAANLPWKKNDRWLLCMPLAHVGGLSVVTRCLLGRKAVVFHPKFDADRVLDTIAKGEITRVSVVPTMLFDLLAKDRDNHLAKLETVLLGGAAASPKLLEECARRKIRALTTYGLTEACSQVTTQRPRDPQTLEAGSGHALAGTEIKITNDDGTLCKPVEIGSISIRGKTLMRGYVGADLLAGNFFDTGDVGALDDQGRLHVASRRRDVIISGGENIYPLEVEAALTSCTGVDAAVVFGVTDERWGETVAAVLVAGNNFDEARVSEELVVKLARFKHPRKIAIVNELPKSEGGKIARAEVEKSFISRLKTWRSP
jgi:O-succinylbenzoic acid--CoA ligase